MNKKFISYIACAAILLVGSVITSCQNKDYESFPVALQPLNGNSIVCELQGDDYVIIWPELQSGLKMQVARLENGTQVALEEVTGTKFVHKNVSTNTEHTYVLKSTDGKNLSKGVVFNYYRQGANPVKGVSISQIDTLGGYGMKITWKKPEDAKTVKLTATTEGRTIEETLDASKTSYTVTGVQFEQNWNVALRAVNDAGPSHLTFSEFRIGTTLIGFLSEYPTEAELIANGDDDEASAWLWTKATYPNAHYVYFGDIKSAEQLNEYRVLFWLRDISSGRWEDAFEYSADVQDATPFISKWYKNGGSLLLWSHAVTYIEQLGRLEEGTITAPGSDFVIGTGAGWNGAGDDWVLAVSAYPGEQFKIDFTTHPIYAGFENDIVPLDGDSWKAIHFLGPGWREDHNCTFFNLPGKLTGKGNQDKACYDLCVSEYGIIPLGTWDSQRWWIGQLNVWEAQQGKTDCKGTIICIGNGGCEFSQNNPDGSKDVSAYPKNNIYQDNILRLAKNSLEYLKTR